MLHPVQLMAVMDQVDRLEKESDTQSKAIAGGKQELEALKQENFTEAFRKGLIAWLQGPEMGTECTQGDPWKKPCFRKGWKSRSAWAIGQGSAESRPPLDHWLEKKTVRKNKQY